MDTIIFILFILSATLLYSILLVSVETRTFEMGISRMLGLKKFGVVIYLNKTFSSHCS
jgi:ABC-type antimicrobial peptide transport system permease subunit